MMIQPLKKPRKAKRRPPQKKVESEEKVAYRHYIRSKDFQRVKDMVHRRDKETCQFCGRTMEDCSDRGITLQVHHRCYEHLGCADEREAADCILLCQICHKAAHSAKSNIGRFRDKHSIFENLNRRNKEDKDFYK